jgi:LysM repeat protein
VPPENTAAFSETITDVPPLAGTDSAAPAWNGSTSGASDGVAAMPMVPPVSLPTEVPSATVAQEPAATTEPTNVPADLPPIPELPPVAAVTDTTTAPTTIPAEAAPIPLPVNLPGAQYPGGATDTTATTVPVTSPTAEAVSPDDRYGALSTDTTSAAPTATPNAMQIPEPVTPTTTTPATPTFASDWPKIQGALERQELVAAHEMLSSWYGNPSLTPAESQQVEVLLSQLAGTVVYSTEHRLEPPYTVHAGDTLQTIAQQYDVPWQLLAKINGVPAPTMVQPGQQLKVVHGPFSAVVELDKNQLTLMLDGRYAGRFPITIPSGVNVSEGRWVLEQKLVQPATQESGVVSASYTTATVEHVLVLRNETAAGETISITAGPGVPSGATAIAPAAIRLSPHDVEEVADILSVGSPVTIRR